MQRLLVSGMTFLFTVASLIAQVSGDKRGAELLKQARAALGGEGKLTKIQGLSAAGTTQRTMGDRQISGELTLDLQLPDKMVRTESISPMGDATIVTLTGINGEQVLRNSRTIGGGPGMMIRMGQPPTGADAEAQALRNARAELARLAVALLLTATPSMPVEFSYGGEAESDDGKADVLDVKGPGSFAAKVFLDKSTHRPLMLTYRGVAPRILMQRVGGPGPQRSEGPPRGEGERGQRGDDHAAAAPPAPEPVDIGMFLDDYKQVDGVWLPHHISRAIDGKPNEEWTFKTIKVNPAFKPDAFSGR